MVVARGYVVTRFFGLPAAIIFALLSLVQAMLCRQAKKKKMDLKYFIHVCCCGMMVGVIIVFSDPDGVYGVIPYIVDKFTVHTAGILMQAGFCFVVYSHFHAHFLSLREPMPKHFATIFTWITAIGMVITYLGNILAFVTDRRAFFVIDTLKTLFYTIVVLITDLYGYYLVHHLIVEQISRNKFGDVHYRGQKTKAQPHKEKDKRGKQKATTKADQQHQQQQQQQAAKTSKSRTHVSKDYEDILSRLCKFHSLVTLACAVFILTNILLLKSNLSAGPGATIVIPKDNPDTMTLNTTAFGYLFIFVWSFYTWWSWVPLRPDPNQPQSQSSTGHSSQETTHLASSGKAESSKSHHDHSVKEEGSSTETLLQPSATTVDLQIWNPHLVTSIELEGKDRTSSVCEERGDESGVIELTLTEGVDRSGVLYLSSAGSEPGSPLGSANSSGAVTPLESVPTTPSLLPTAPTTPLSSIILSPSATPTDYLPTTPEEAEEEKDSV